MVKVSPLQEFTDATVIIKRVYTKLHNHVKDVETLIKDVQNISDIRDNVVVADLDLTLKRINYAIHCELSRNKLKVAFVGRTSAGKSAVINAMLHKEILPSEMGHTTDCIIQIEGSPSNEAYLTKQHSDAKQNIENITQLAHALAKSDTQKCDVVNIFWPREKCDFLKYDVILVDSPGKDMGKTLDEMIHSYCSDADLFVLVIDAGSTTSLADKELLNTIFKLSKFNIIILVNKWDLSDNSKQPEKVRDQHNERYTSFLMKDLQVCKTLQEAEDRIFFISAIEALSARQNENAKQSASTLTEPMKIRDKEFQNYENKFEESISGSAIRTKFTGHSEQGRNIIRNVESVLDKVHKDIILFENQKLSEMIKLREHFANLEEQLTQIIKFIEKDIDLKVNQIKQQIATALNDEIRSLSSLVDDFNFQINWDEPDYDRIKRELLSLIEKHLETNLKSRLSENINLIIKSAYREMAEKLRDLLQQKKQQEPVEIFEISYYLNCETILSDFQENLNMTITKQQEETRNLDSEERNLIGKIFSGALDVIKIIADSNVDPKLIAGLAFTSACNMVTNTAIEKAHETVFKSIMDNTNRIEDTIRKNAIKEELFKKQYTQFATERLKSNVDRISTNWSQQIQETLSTSLKQLSVDKPAYTDITIQLQKLENDIQELKKAATTVENLKKKSILLNNDLDAFNKDYLKASH